MICSMGVVALRCRRRFLHPRRRTKVLRVGEKTSEKAKLCFMQHLKVTFNRIKADVFSRFTTELPQFVRTAQKQTLMIEY